MREKEGKAAGCTDNAFFICLAELKLQVCLRLLWIKEMGDALQYCLPTQQKSNLFFPSSLQNFTEWYPDSRELQTLNQTLSFICLQLYFSLCLYASINSTIISEHNENLSNLKSSWTFSKQITKNVMKCIFLTN